MGCAACRREDTAKTGLSKLDLNLTEDHFEEIFNSLVSAGQPKAPLESPKVIWQQKQADAQLRALVDNEVPMLGLSDYDQILHLNNVMNAVGVLKYLEYTPREFVDFLRELSQLHTSLPFNSFTLTVCYAAQLYRLYIAGKNTLDRYLTPDDRALLFITALAPNFKHRSV